MSMLHDFMIACRHWFGKPVDRGCTCAVMALAKRSERLLTEQEVLETVQAARRRNGS